jgi:acyl dehydratase
MRFNSIADLLAEAPCDLGWTDWVRISQDDVLKFADATRAHEWIHTDPDRARAGPFGGPVAHGFLTLALATFFQTQLLELGSTLVGVNYGLGRARFPAPVPVDSEVRAFGRLVSAEPSHGGVRLHVELTYELDRGGKPPCVAEIVSLALPNRELDRR